MAIIDKNAQNWDKVSADEDQFIGLALPLILDNGQEASTKTTIEAVKQNVLMLCSTEAGERVMQPNLGVKLKRFLFEPFTDDLVTEVEAVIKDGLDYWLPFVNINSINVEMPMTDEDINKNRMNISVSFSLKKSAATQDSVQITVYE